MAELKKVEKSNIHEIEASIGNMSQSDKLRVGKDNALVNEVQAFLKVTMDSTTYSNVANKKRDVRRRQILIALKQNTVLCAAIREACDFDLAKVGESFEMDMKKDNMIENNTEADAVVDMKKKLKAQIWGVINDAIDGDGLADLEDLSDDEDMSNVAVDAGSTVRKLNGVAKTASRPFRRDTEIKYFQLGAKWATGATGATGISKAIEAGAQKAKFADAAKKISVSSTDIEMAEIPAPPTVSVRGKRVPGASMPDLEDDNLFNDEEKIAYAKQMAMKKKAMSAADGVKDEVVSSTATMCKERVDNTMPVLGTFAEVIIDEGVASTNSASEKNNKLFEADSNVASDDKDMLSVAKAGEKRKAMSEIDSNEIAKRMHVAESNTKAVAEKDKETKDSAEEKAGDTAKNLLHIDNTIQFAAEKSCTKAQNEKALEMSLKDSNAKAADDEPKDATNKQEAIDSNLKEPGEQNQNESMSSDNHDKKLNDAKAEEAQTQNKNDALLQENLTMVQSDLEAGDNVNKKRSELKAQDGGEKNCAEAKTADANEKKRNKSKTRESAKKEKKDKKDKKDKKEKKEKREMVPPPIPKFNVVTDNQLNMPTASRTKSVDKS